MKQLLTISLLFISFFGFSQKTTLTVKKNKQIEGVYYQKLNKYEFKYMRFEGDTVSVWTTSSKPKKKQEYSYSDFVKSSLKQNKTAYQITDSLLTFTFSTKHRNGDYTFEDYHCILDNPEKLIIKKGSTINIVKIETYLLYKPYKKKKLRFFRRDELRSVKSVN